MLTDATFILRYYRFSCTFSFLVAKLRKNFCNFAILLLFGPYFEYIRYENYSNHRLCSAGHIMDMAGMGGIVGGTDIIQPADSGFFRHHHLRASMAEADGRKQETKMSSNEPGQTRNHQESR